MKSFRIYIVIMSFAFISSCDTSQIECIRASSNIVSETRDHKDFRGVVFSNVGDIYLTQGSEYSYTIVGPDNVVELTSSEVENEVLVIGTNTCFNGDYELRIEITAPEYKYINLSGVGDVTTVNQIDGDILAIDMMGVGDIEADVYVDSLYTTITGTGSVNYTGEVLKHELTSSGIFTVNSFDLGTTHTEINIAGEGNAHVRAKETLSVIIEGNGNVYYKGNPTIHKEISGTGEVINDN